MAEEAEDRKHIETIKAAMERIAGAQREIYLAALHLQAENEAIKHVLHEHFGVRLDIISVETN